MDFFLKCNSLRPVEGKKARGDFLLLLKSTNDHCFQFYEERIIENSNSHDENIRLLDEIRRLSHKKNDSLTLKLFQLSIMNELFRSHGI